jgi:hypothetical protein
MYVSDVGTCGPNTCLVSAPSYYLRFHVPQPTAGYGGLFLEVVGVPDRIRAMTATPDGHWLVAISLSSIMRVDLTQQTPASVQRHSFPRVARASHEVSRPAPIGPAQPTILTTHARKRR